MRDPQFSTKLDSQSSELSQLKNKVDLLEKQLESKQEIIADLEQRFKQSGADSQVLVEDLRTEVQQLRGRQEELSHNFDVTKAEVQRLRQDVQNSAVDKTTRAETDITLYDKTLKLILEEKDYTQAIAKFRAFLDKYPQSSLADNAAYWIGEAYYAQDKFKEALVEFQNLADRYPKSDKLCGALLKQGICFEKLNENDKAKLFFEETRFRCKETPEAKYAGEHLEKFKPAESKESLKDKDKDNDAAPEKSGKGAGKAPAKSSTKSDKGK